MVENKPSSKSVPQGLDSAPRWIDNTERANTRSADLEDVAKHLTPKNLILVLGGFGLAIWKIGIELEGPIIAIGGMALFFAAVSVAAWLLFLYIRTPAPSKPGLLWLKRFSVVVGGFFAFLLFSNWMFPGGAIQLPRSLGLVGTAGKNPSPPVPEVSTTTQIAARPAMATAASENPPSQPSQPALGPINHPRGAPNSPAKTAVPGDTATSAMRNPSPPSLQAPMQEIASHAAPHRDGGGPTPPLTTAPTSSKRVVIFRDTVTFELCGELGWAVTPPPGIASNSWSLFRDVLPGERRPFRLTKGEKQTLPNEKCTVELVNVVLTPVPSIELLVHQK